MTSRAAADEFVRALKAKYGDRIERVILFGSVARGDNRPDSDIDLIVVTREDRLALQGEIAGDVVDWLLRTGTYVSAKVLRPEEMERVRDTFFGCAVAAEGVVLG